MAVRGSAGGSPFDRLPDDILGIIFAFTPSELPSLARLLSVSKRFYSRLRQEEGVWGVACINWWEEKGFSEQGFDLMKAFQEIKKARPDFNWLWFPKCFRKAPGYDYREMGDTSTDPDIINKNRQCVSLGEYGKDGLHGFGVTISFNSVRFGTYEGGKAAGKITKVWNDGERFEGDYENDRRSGVGRYVFADGTFYQGNFKEGSFSGEGTMTWPDFQYTGQWERGQPKDTEAATHPKNRECIKNGTCTILFTDKTTKYSQTRYLCEQCDKWYCDTCKDKCHPTAHPNATRESWKIEWFVGSYCECGEQCAKAPEPTKKKAKV